MWLIGALFFVAWLGEPYEAGDRPALSVDAAPALHCPASERALAALARQLAPRAVVRAVEPRGRFHLTLRAHGANGVTMTLRSASRLLVDRTVDVAPHECEGLADTVALITAAWVRDADNEARGASPDTAPAGEAPPDRAASDREEGRAHDAPTPAPPERTSAAPAGPTSPATPTQESASAARPARTRRAPRAEAPRTTSSARVEATQAPEPPRADEARDAEPTRAEATAQAPAPAPPPSEAPTQVSPPPAPARRVRLSLEGALGTTVSLDGLAVPTLTGRAGLELTRKHLRVGVRGNAESARDIDPSGAISVRHAQLELAAGAGFAEGGMLHGAVLLGAGVDLIAAQASGHTRDDVQRSFTPIGSLALRACLRAHAALDVFASSELVLALRRERFTADGEPLAQTARSRARLLVGVSWHVF